MRTESPSARARLLASASIALWALAAPAGANEEELPTSPAVDPARLEQLEERVRELEGASEAAPASQSRIPEWVRRVRLGGSARVGYYRGESDSVHHPPGFEVSDARLFVDAELGDEVQVAERTLLRNVGVSFEWNLVRVGRLANDVGDLYADFQGVAGSPWANLQIGRFQIPVGEAYLRYGRGMADDPFVSKPVGGPWWWDEGVRMYGSDTGQRLGYVASVTNGETPFNSDESDDPQVTLKVYGRPASWLYLSASGLYGGRIGSSTEPAAGALWLGESWARAFGNGTSVPNYADGELVPDGPNELRRTALLGADAIVDLGRHARLWLGYGTYSIDTGKGQGAYDRRLHYWVAELLVSGALATPELDDFYVGLRGNGLGTYRDAEGYLLDVRYGRSLGYNMKSLDGVSVVLGWQPLAHAALRLEYTHQHIGLVDGVTSDIWDDSRKLDYAALEIGLDF